MTLLTIIHETVIGVLSYCFKVLMYLNFWSVAFFENLLMLLLLLLLLIDNK